ALRQTADRKTRGKLTSSRRGTWGPIRRLQLTCSELIIHFRQSDLELLFSQERCDGLFDSLTFVLFTTLCMSCQTSCVTFPSPLTHVSPPDGGGVAAPILRQCIRVLACRFSPCRSPV